MFIRTRFTKWLTFGFASGITLFPFVFVRPGIRLNRRLVVHEKIHIQQQKELLVIPFFLLYLLEYLFNLVRYKNHYQAYYYISFEQEAYLNDKNMFYLKKRKPFSWLKYYKKLSSPNR